MKLWQKYKGQILLFALLVLLPWLAYSYGLKGSVVKRRENRRINREIMMQQEHMAARNVSPELTGVPGYDKDLIESGTIIELLSEITESSGISIRRYTPVVTRSEEGITVNAAGISLSGNYIGAVKIIDFIEREIPSCKIVSVNIKSGKDVRTGKTNLTHDIIIRQILHH